MNAVGLTLFQVRYVNKAFWRNPASAFFTFAFPLMFLVIFTALLGHGTVAPRRPRGAPVDLLRRGDGRLRGDHRLLQQHRDQPRPSSATAGVLKRTNGTPLPAGVYLARAGAARAARGRAAGRDHRRRSASVAYSADIPTGAHAAALRGRCSSSGAAALLRARVRGHRGHPQRRRRRADRQRDDPAAAVPVRRLHPDRRRRPAWITWTARIFPVKHFADGMQAGFLGTTFHWTDVLVVAVWGVAGLAAGACASSAGSRGAEVVVGASRIPRSPGPPVG